MSIINLVTQKPQGTYDSEWREDFAAIYSYEFKRKHNNEIACIKKVNVMVVAYLHNDTSRLVNKVKPQKFFFNNLFLSPRADRRNLEIMLLEKNCCHDTVDVMTDYRLDRHDVNSMVEFLQYANGLQGSLVYVPTKWLLELYLNSAIIKEKLGQLIGVDL